MSEGGRVRLDCDRSRESMRSGTQAAERSVIEELLPKVRFSKL